MRVNICSVCVVKLFFRIFCYPWLDYFIYNLRTNVNPSYRQFKFLSYRFNVRMNNLLGGMVPNFITLLWPLGAHCIIQDVFMQFIHSYSKYRNMYNISIINSSRIKFIACYHVNP